MFNVNQNLTSSLRREELTASSREPLTKRVADMQNTVT